ncbi:ATP-dependent Clp protease ATP-binding subunit CLPT2, chloroplastic-like [Vicia villosa]|uniref:ATP-dependent Clp protease ATP-binding subunit CLPT2, chloroplastic-like n=1 Tax=Vicia villosa TaxID=3911 RepID=UPI00273BCE8A|nr:ATP-dependent Clp protease ATP-binding subunit CLPT2, chloroplastic-like [Vicia villosa]
MAAPHFHCTSTLVSRSNPSFRLLHNLKLTNPNNSWLGTKIRVQPCILSAKPPVSISHRRPVAATVSFSLPTSNPERVSPGQETPKWSSKAIKSISMAEVEARKLRFTNTGTEALILGVLVEGTNLANKFLRANGITIFKVRDEIVKVVGKNEIFSVPPVPERPPMTEDAQKALDWAVDKKLKSDDGGEVTTTHIILGIWSEVDSPGHKILSNLGFDDKKAKELESSISKAVVNDE